MATIGEEKLVFSQQALLNLKGNDEIVELFLKRLTETNLLSKIKYVESEVPPHDSLRVIKNKVREIFAENDFGIMSELSGTQIANLTFLMPDKVWSQETLFLRKSTEMTSLELVAVFLEESNVCRIIDQLQKYPKLPASANLVMIVALASSHYEINENPTDEVRLLRFLLSRITEKDNFKLVHTAISKRIKNLINPADFSKLPAGPKALLVTGQLRGYQGGIGTIWSQLRDRDKIDVYVSTWRNPGASTINEHRIGRRFTAEAAEYVQKKDIDYVDLQRYVEMMKSPLTAESLEMNLASLFPGARSVNIKIHNELDYPFNQMTNPEKMYFQNAYWIYRLGKKYFNETYQEITKIRPDFRMRVEPEKNLSDAHKHTLTADKGGWLLDVWGFGMADQFISGPSELMTEVLGISGYKNISTKLLIHVFGRSDEFMGHVNCGLEAWCSGVTIEPVAAKVYSFSEVEPLDLDFVQQYERWKR